MLASLALALGCKPAAGSPCEKGEARCLDSARSLTCEAGQFVETPCRGKKGCSTSEAGTECDVSGNRAGDRCSKDEQGSAACVDATHLIVCRNGSFAPVACRGPRGCALEAGRPLCDASVGLAGDGCREDGQRACAEDKSSVLECRAGKLELLYRCRGPSGCAAARGKLDCDMGVAERGDRCDAKLEGHVACAADRGATLICRAGKFERDAPCKPGTACVAGAGRTGCEKRSR